MSPNKYRVVVVGARNFSAKRERSLSPKDLVECKQQDVPGSVHIAVPSLSAEKIETD